MIKNPILPGFNADPSIIRVNDTYYIACSSFEWWPGVSIHESKDLKNWHLITRPLNETRLLDMKGNPDSGGIWAPALSYCDGKFYLIYTDVKVTDGSYKDCTNYLITAEDIMGPWSDPITLNTAGFDASLFHDEDGKKYLLNMYWDPRTYKHPFYGIMCTEYSEKEQKLVGESRKWSGEKTDGHTLWVVIMVWNMWKNRQVSKNMYGKKVIRKRMISTVKN